MKEKMIKEFVGEAVLSLTEKYARKKANSFCKGKMYEPTVPQKLVKNREERGNEKNECFNENEQ